MCVLRVRAGASRVQGDVHFRLAFVPSPDLVARISAMRLMELLAVLVVASLRVQAGGRRYVRDVSDLEQAVVAALYSGSQDESLVAIDAYRQHLTAQMGEVTMAQGLQAMFQIDHEPASMYSIMSLWLDSFGHVDAFYRAQEAVMLARIAQHENSSGQPAEAADGGLFGRFSEEPVFRFFHPSAMFPADPNALALARGVDSELAEALIATGDSPVGYIPELLAATHPPEQPTMNTCRHIKRLTLLLHQLRADGVVGPARGKTPGRAWQSLRIAEIGGGNGNMARLVGATPSLGFASWTIFDFPVMTRLQRWYLEQTLDSDGYDVVQNLDLQTAAEREGRGLVRLVDTHNFWNHLSELDAAEESASAGDVKAGEWDVLIASHSWSELPLDTFRMYLAALGGRYRYLLYCTQVEWPSEEEVKQKLKLLTLAHSHAHGGAAYTEVARLESAHDGRPMLTLVFRRSTRRGQPGTQKVSNGPSHGGAGADARPTGLAQLRALSVNEHGL